MLQLLWEQGKLKCEPCPHKKNAFIRLNWFRSRSSDSGEKRKCD